MTRQWTRAMSGSESDNNYAGALDSHGNLIFGHTNAPHADATLLRTIADAVIWSTIDITSGGGLSLDWFQYIQFGGAAARTVSGSGFPSGITNGSRPEIVGTGTFRQHLAPNPSTDADLTIVRWEMDTIDSEGERKVITPGTTPSLWLGAAPYLGFPAFSPGVPWNYTFGSSFYLRALWEW